MENGIIGDGTLKDGIVKNGVCSSESVNGSCDVWSCKDSDSSSADHLVVMVHGILGSASDWKFAAEQFVRMLPDKVIVHCSERNVSRRTLDGVDVMGERLAREVLEVIQRKPHLRKISFVAHSVGGLVARYAIGILYRPPQKENVEDSAADTSEEDAKATIGGLEPINFITVATPHLGSRGNKQVPFLFGVTAFEKAAGLVIHWIFKRTGRHLFLTDDDEGKPPLLKRMIEDYCDCFFMCALRAFKRRVVYSNVGYDHIVGWRTSSIRRNNELPKWEDYVNEKYPHIVYEERCKAYDAEQCDLISTEDNSSDKLEEELVTGLSRVSWEKVDVSFHTCRQRFAAHSVIQSYPNPLQNSQAYAIVKQNFVIPEDAVAQKIVVRKDSSRGVHFRRAGPREKVYFTPEEVRACIVTCGGLCPGINTVIREIVCGLNYMYGVNDILGIQGGYRGFYSKNTVTLTPKVVNDIHKRGGTFLCTSRGGHDTNKIVDNIQDRGINQEVEKRGLQVAVAGIPKTIDNDIAVIDKSFGFDTAVEEAQRAINAAHVEVESVENGVGIVKLMGRYSGFIAMYATLASRDVDCCLIPESPFYLEGPGGLFEFIEQRLKENGHLVIVIAEGAGQEYAARSTHRTDERDASGNRLLLDVGLWLSQYIKDHFMTVRKMQVNMKYIDPTYMIRAIPSNASDNIYCTLLAHSAVHGAMAGYTGFTVGPVNSKHAYIPIARVTEAQNTVKLTDRMWARLLASTNQPSFLNSNGMSLDRIDGETVGMRKDNTKISST
ncbi:hypothetical protein GH714_025904 [Hevea brasiliensis]|uniref:Phosphohexokinase n=1 Tax=Hevea brasiliensis TaxID=3981 RepID=A0A6A6MD93_HEVBR|nr:hypothetical protein GH714_025904 [Hevea brasiliensis]